MSTNLIASGQITIIDHNDGKTLIAEISDNKKSGGFFSYNPDVTGSTAFEPAINNIEITAKFTTSDRGGVNLLDPSDSSITSKKWYIRTYSGGDTEIVSGQNGYVISNNGSVLKLPVTDTSTHPLRGDDPSVSFVLKIAYKDPIFASDASINPEVIELEHTLNRLVKGTNATYGSIWFTNGKKIFYNASENERIELNAALYVGGDNKLESGSISGIKWYFYDDNKVGGAGWTLLDESKDPSHEIILNGGKTLSICASEVDGTEIFKVEMPYEGKTYTASETVQDYTDPFRVDVKSETGNIFKKGMVNKTLRAVVYETDSNGQTNIVTDPDTKFTFSWDGFDNAGNPITNNSDWTSANKTSSTLIIKPSMVSISATYIVSVAKKETVSYSRLRRSGFRSLM